MLKILCQKLLFVLIVLLLIVVGYYWNVGFELFNEQLICFGQDNIIDYYVENVYSFQYQEDGSFDYEMIVVKLEYQKVMDIIFVIIFDLLFFCGNV